MRILLILFIFSIPFIGEAQYQIASKTMTSKKTTIKTRWLKGYVILNAGKKREGEIKLKVVNGDTVEVEMKLPNGDKKTYDRRELRTFGPASSVEATDSERTVFQSGYVMEAGTKSEGQVALIFEKEGKATTDYFVYEIRLKTNDGVKSYTTETSNVDVVVQDIRGEKTEYHRYEDGWSKIIRSGKLFLAQNPYSTSVNKLASKLADAATDYLADEMKKKADTQAEKDQLKEAKKQDMTVYFDEYIVKQGANGPWKIIRRKNAEKWAKELLQSCSAYKKADKKKQEQLTDSKMRYIHNTVNFYNRKCG